VDPRFARVLAQLLPARGEIYVASDWLEVAMEIQECLVGTGVFVVLGDNQEACCPPPPPPPSSQPPKGPLFSMCKHACRLHRDCSFLPRVGAPGMPPG
jgi:hypothetical protein